MVATATSGIITVTTAGTAVQGGDIDGSSFLIKAHPSNTGLAYVGNDGAGDVSSTTGYPLSAGDQTVIDIQNLKHLWFDTAVNGEKVCWLRLA